MQNVLYKAYLLIADQHLDWRARAYGIIHKENKMEHAQDFANSGQRHPFGFAWRNWTLKRNGPTYRSVATGQDGKNNLSVIISAG
jgi:hypothetical protein